MSGIKFDVDAAAARLRSDPAKVANLANLAGEGGNFSKISNFSNPSPPIGPTPRADLDAPSPGISLGGLSESVRPSRATCQAQGCAMWTSGGRDDRACSWRCIGSIVHDGADPEDAPRPRLADLDACPYGKLNTGTGLDWWPPFPPEGEDFGAYESAGSLLDLARRHGLKVEVTGGKAMIVYPVNAPPALVAYADQLLEEGLSYILTMKNVVAEAPEAMQ